WVGVAVAGEFTHAFARQAVARLLVLELAYCADDPACSSWGSGAVGSYSPGQWPSAKRLRRSVNCRSVARTRAFTAPAGYVPPGCFTPALTPVSSSSASSIVEIE